jgi:hypothetical protein
VINDRRGYDQGAKKENAWSMLDGSLIRTRLAFSAVGLGDGGTFDGVSRDPQSSKAGTEPPDALEG